MIGFSLAFCRKTAEEDSDFVTSNINCNHWLPAFLQVERFHEILSNGPFEGPHGRTEPKSELVH